jgi:DMSO/TMAO reductase YedYZ molybdopterin-dependent catalytic subunit
LKTPFRVALALQVAALALGVAGCARLLPPSATPIAPAASQESTVATATSLASVEVRSYKGQRLDAVSAEPENSIQGPQHIDVGTYRLSVKGAVANPLTLTYQQVTDMPAFQKATTLNCVEGWSVTYLWQGVRLKDLLARAGYDSSATVVIFRSYDGYSTSLPLSYVVGRDILLAYRMNGVTMPPERGFPFQVVAEDRYGYKWAKWVTEIEVSNDQSFRGYWEQRGYDNGASLESTTR